MDREKTPQIRARAIRLFRRSRDWVVRLSPTARVMFGLFYVFGRRNGVQVAEMGLANRSECCTDLGREQLWFFPSGEMAALVDLVEVDDIGIRLLDPAARSTPDLAGERREANWNRDGRWRVTDRTRGFLAFLPV